MWRLDRVDGSASTWPKFGEAAWPVPKPRK